MGVNEGKYYANFEYYLKIAIMKHQPFFLLLILILSCGKPGNENNTNNKSIINENGVIGYTNTLVDFMNNTGVHINKAAKDFSVIVTMVSSKKKADFKGTAFKGVQLNNEKEDEKILNKGTGLPAAVKSDIVKKVDAIIEAYKNVREAYTTFVTYFNNDDYENDEWEKGSALVGQMEKNITAYYAQGEAAYSMLKPLANKAEIELLEDHPLRDAMVATKTDLGVAKKLLSLLTKEAIEINKIEKLYETLASNMNKNKSAFVEVLKEKNKDQYYNKFYADIAQFLSEIRKNKEDGKFTLNEMNSIQRGYKNLLSSYNDFELYLIK